MLSVSSPANPWSRCAARCFDLGRALPESGVRNCLSSAGALFPLRRRYAAVGALGLRPRLSRGRFCEDASDASSSDDTSRLRFDRPDALLPEGVMDRGEGGAEGKRESLDRVFGEGGTDGGTLDSGDGECL